MNSGDLQGGHARIHRIQLGARAIKWAISLCNLIVLLFWLEDVLSILMPTHPLFVDGATIDIGDTERGFAKMSLNQLLPLVALVTVSYGLLGGITLSVRSVCLRFQTADFFSSRTLDAVFYSGVWFISYATYNIAATPIATYIATLDFPEGERAIDVAIGGHEILSLILGALMLLLGWVMREAALLAEENTQII
ncbi:MAG: hypothetical protein JJ866_22500 [Roseibium sp.]|uniref:hypothetical protein n=1 Tax=Roseibium sp. TaxID=1936156 RepID=UPI001B27A72A|nr:hypothetical protein [Roseibium sp.]MBO6894729.1 hypothetical protein [Roseibium sp.]MBO6928082.1 hypothetical protein [Roseibium sp.]